MIFPVLRPRRQMTVLLHRGLLPRALAEVGHKAANQIGDIESWPESAS